MGTVMVFVPAPVGAWSAALEPEAVRAWSATPAVHEAFDLPPRADEDAEYAAMLLASVAALASTGRRRVLGFEVAADQVSDNGDETVTVTRLRPTQLVSWFADADDVDAAPAASASAGLDVDAAWELPEVADLVEHHPLLWHAAEELED